MEKDIFNGKVKPEHKKFGKCSIISASVVMIILATALILFAVFYDQVQYDAQIALYIICALAYLFAVLAPLVTILCIRKYPKYKRLTKLFIDVSFLVDIDKKEG